MGCPKLRLLTSPYWYHFSQATSKKYGNKSCCPAEQSNYVAEEMEHPCMLTNENSLSHKDEFRGSEMRISG